MAEVHFGGAKSVVIVREVSCNEVPEKFIAKTTEKYCFEPRWFEIKNHNK